MMTALVTLVMWGLCEFGIHDGWHFTELLLGTAILFDIVGLMIG